MTKKKLLKHSSKKCGGTLETEYTEEDIPILVCDTCGHRIEDWVKWHSTYCNFWQEEEKWGSKKDHLVCLLGYFSHLYQQHYQTSFTFSLNEKGLFRGPEIYQLRRMYAMFGSDVMLARAYMDWLFKTKVAQRKRRITSLGFLATPGVITEFKLYLQNSKRIRRNTPLPPGMISWIEEHIPGLKQIVALADHGDLHLLLSHYQKGHFREAPEIKTFVEKLQTCNYINQDLTIHNWEG